MTLLCFCNFRCTFYDRIAFDLNGVSVLPHHILLWAYACRAKCTCSFDGFGCLTRSFAFAVRFQCEMYYRAIACRLAVRVCIHGSCYLDIFMPDLEQATLKPFVTHKVASRNLVLVSLFDFSYSVFTDGIIWTSLCQIWIKPLWDFSPLMRWRLETLFWLPSLTSHSLCARIELFGPLYARSGSSHFETFRHS